MADSYDEEMIGICAECGSDQKDAYMNNNPFFQAGHRVPCQYCGGLVVIAAKSEKEQVLDTENRKRGLK